MLQFYDRQVSVGLCVRSAMWLPELLNAAFFHSEWGRWMILKTFWKTWDYPQETNRSHSMCVSFRQSVIGSYITTQHNTTMAEVSFRLWWKESHEQQESGLRWGSQHAGAAKAWQVASNCLQSANVGIIVENGTALWFYDILFTVSLVFYDLRCSLNSKARRV